MSTGQPTKRNATMAAKPQVTDAARAALVAAGVCWHDPEPGCDCEWCKEHPQ